MIYTVIHAATEHLIISAIRSFKGDFPDVRFLAVFSISPLEGSLISTDRFRNGVCGISGFLEGGGLFNNFLKCQFFFDGCICHFGHFSTISLVLRYTDRLAASSTFCAFCSRPRRLSAGTLFFIALSSIAYSNPTGCLASEERVVRGDFFLLVLFLIRFHDSMEIHSSFGDFYIPSVL